MESGDERDKRIGRWFCMSFAVLVAIWAPDDTLLRIASLVAVIVSLFLL